MKPSCYGLLLLLSFAACAVPEAEFEQLRASVFSAAKQSSPAAIARIDALLLERQDLSVAQQIRLRYHKAIYLHRSNQTDAAIAVLAECKSMSRQTAEPNILYSYHNILANIFDDAGIYQQALEHYQHALALTGTLSPLYLHQTENNLALVLQKLGQLKDAEHYFQRFYQYGLSANNPDVQAVALNNLGDTALVAGQLSQAERYHQQALALRLLHQLPTSWSILNLAKVALRQQDYAKASLLARHSLYLRRNDNELNRLEPQLVLAESLAGQGDLSAADETLQQELRLAARYPASEWLLKGWQLQADLALRQQKPAQAVIAMQQALQVANGQAEHRFALTLAQNASEINLASREAQISALQQQRQLEQAATAAREQRLWLLGGATSLIALLSLLFSMQIRSKNRALAQRARELADTRQQLIDAEKLAALTPLVTGVAHQLNTPLGTVLTAVSCSDSQLKALADKLNNKQLNLQDLQHFISEQQQLLQLAQQSTERAADLVSRFKLISAQSQSPGETIELPSYLQNLLRHQLMAMQAGDVQLALEGPVCRLSVELPLLSTILQVLTENALQHGRPSSGPLQLQLSWQLCPAPPTAPPADWLQLQFCDNGRGIAAADAARIFDPFYTTGLGQGRLGLGLSIAFNAAQRLGGQLHWQPSAKGCCFVLTLPLQSGAA